MPNKQVDIRTAALRKEETKAQYIAGIKKQDATIDVEVLKTKGIKELAKISLELRRRLNHD